MIDWDKPIQTDDGRPAKVLSKTGYWFNGETYGVVQVESESGNSLLHVVNPITGRGFSGIPTFRNVSVKREGWVRVWNRNGFWSVFSDVVFAEKASAEEACKKLGGVPAFVVWEE